MVASNAVAVAIADLDADGMADLAVACASRILSVLRGHGDGTFDPAENIPIGADGSIAAADLRGRSHTRTALAG